MTLEVLEDTPAQALLPGSDVDGDALTFHLLSQPKLGRVELVDAATGAWRFTPRQDLNGDDAFTFDVTDSRTTVKGTVKLHIVAVNDAPLLEPLALSTREDESVDGALHGSDVDGDKLTFAVVTPPMLGRAFVEGSRIHFEPARDQNGTMTFTVAANDGALTSAPATVTVDIAPVNDAPIANAGTLTTDEDTPARGKLVATDVDGDAITFAIARAPAHGTVTLGDGYRYAPAANYNGPDSFAFSATDPSGAWSIAEVKITVVPVNDPPEAVSAHITGPCNGSVSGRLQGFDRESKTVSFRIVKEPSHGRVKLIDAKTGDFVFFTDESHTAEVTFEFVAFDGEASSAPAEVTVHLDGSCGTSG
jgi:hypothetical protein